MKWLKRIFRREPIPSIIVSSGMAGKRYEAAMALLRKTPPEVVSDALLIIALGAPMTLVSALAEAGATIVQEPPPPMAAETRSIN